MLEGDMPKEEREFREALQAGLPNPVNEGACLVIRKRQAVSTVLSGSLKPDQFMTAAIAAANELHPGTTPSTIALAVFNAATLGLMFGAVRGEAFLVPYFNGKKSKEAGRDVFDCQLIVGYKGFRNLAYRTSFLKSFTTEVVLKDEPFEVFVDEDGRHLKHAMKVDREPMGNGSNVVAAYCVYQTRTGGTGVVWIGRKELERAKPEKSDIWRQHYPAMAQKTAIRRAAKEWDVTEQLAGAILIDEQAEAGLSQQFLCDPKLVDGFEAEKQQRRRKTGESRLQDELERLKAEKDLTGETGDAADGV